MKTLACLLVSVTLPVSFALAEKDPFTGVWNLKVQESRYPHGDCPKRMRIEMESVGEGVRYRSETIDKNGSSRRAEYTAGYDGREAIVTGTAGLMMPVSLKRLNSHIVVASYRRALQVRATSRRVVSSDGRIMTITTVSRDRNGKVVTNVGVYERAAPDWKPRGPR